MRAQVLEATLRDFKFELPSTAISQLEVDAQMVREPEKALRRILGDVPSDDVDSA